MSSEKAQFDFAMERLKKKCFCRTGKTDICEDVMFGGTCKYDIDMLITKAANRLTNQIIAYEHKDQFRGAIYGA